MPPFKTFKNARPAIAAATHADIAQARTVLLGAALPFVRAVLTKVAAERPVTPEAARQASEHLSNLERLLTQLTDSARLVDATPDEVAAIEARGRADGLDA